MNNQALDTDLDASENTKQETSHDRVSVLESKIATLTEQITQSSEQHLRAQAEWANLLKRKDQEREQAVRHAQSEFLKEFIFVLDSLESGLFSLKQSIGSEPNGLLDGLDMIQRQTLQLLEKFDLVVLSPEVGTPFDPAIAEAMSIQFSDQHPANSVLMVIQRGYMVKGRVLRPARVIVAKNDC